MLPRLIVIADGFTDPAVAARAAAAAEAGAPWLILRDRSATPLAFLESASVLVTRLRALDAPPRISVTAHLDAARALETDVHLGARDARIEDARRVLPSSARIGYSAHTVEEVQIAAAEADYLFVSPVYATTHRPEATPLGEDGLRQFVAAAAPTPVFALGGLIPGRVEVCRDAGAHGVAVLSGIMQADDVASAVRDYLRHLL